MNKKNAKKAVRKSRAKLTEPIKKFYVILPETVQFGDGFNHNMETGRLMAQVAHVARKLERNQALSEDQNSLFVKSYAETTTIVLSVRNSKELKKVYSDLVGIINTGIAPEGFEIPQSLEYFEDTNPGIYGRHRVMTAVMFGPSTSEGVDAVVGHLPLFGA